MCSTLNKEQLPHKYRDPLWYIFIKRATVILEESPLIKSTQYFIRHSSSKVNSESGCTREMSYLSQLRISTFSSLPKQLSR
jgi:hypothetical protein